MADIKSKLQLDGEQQYKKALNDAYRSLRVLRSELKAETAEMGRNATAQDKASKKAASLKKQIEEQKKIVATLKKALEDSKKEYADHQEVQDKWAEKLNKAREALANMENQMKASEDVLHGFGDAMKDVTDGSGDAVGSVISLNDCLKSIGDIAGGVGNTLGNIFTSTVDTMEAMVDEMFSLMGEAWAAAGDWKQIQTIWGGTLEDIEAVMVGANLQGVDTGEITGGIQKLVTNTHNKNKDTIKALKQLGVDEKDYSSHWDYYMAVMKELTMRKGDERYNLATALFGDKKGSGMVDVIDNWNAILDLYNTDVKGTGLELKSPEIEQLDEVAHKITEVQALWDTIRMNIGAKLSEILDMDELSEDVLNVLRDIGKILNGDGDPEITIALDQHIDTLLTDITGAMSNLSGFLDTLAGALQDSTNPTLKFIGDLLASLSGVLDWVADNSDTIIEWLNTLLPMMMGNKVLEATTGEGIGGWMSNLTQLGIGIAQVKLLGSILGESAKTAMGAGAMGAAMGSGFGAALMATVPWLAGLVTMVTPSGGSAEGVDDKGFLEVFGTLEDYIKRQTGFSREQAEAEYNYNRAVWEANGGSWEGEGWNTVNRDDFFNGIGTAVAEALKEPDYQYSNAQIWAAQDYWDAMREGDDTSDEWMALSDAFADEQEKMMYLLDKITEFYNQPGSSESEYLPASMFNLISGALTQKKSDTPIEMKTANQITVNVTLDGETIQRQVSESMARHLYRLVGA